MAAVPSPSALAHRFVIQGSRTSVMYASSQLFGHLPSPILLSRSWDGPDFCSALVVDPVPGGQKFDIQELKPSTLPEFKGDEVLAHSVDLDAFRTSAEAMFKSIRPVIEDRVFGGIATQALEAVFGRPDGKPITQEPSLNRLTNEVASRFTKLLYRLDSETPLPPPEI